MPRRALVEAALASGQAEIDRERLKTLERKIRRKAQLFEDEKDELAVARRRLPTRGSLARGAFRKRKRRPGRARPAFDRCGSGGGIRTPDLRVMSPTSYQTALPRNKMGENVYP